METEACGVVGTVGVVLRESLKGTGDPGGSESVIMGWGDIDDGRGGA